MKKLKLFTIFLILIVLNTSCTSTIKSITISTQDSSQYDVFLNDSLIAKDYPISNNSFYIIQENINTFPLTIRLLESNSDSVYGFVIFIKKENEKIVTNGHHILNIAKAEKGTTKKFIEVGTSDHININKPIQEFIYQVNFGYKKPKIDYGLLAVYTSSKDIDIYDYNKLIGSSSKNKPFIKKIKTGKHNLKFKNKYYSQEETTLNVLKDEIYLYTISDINKIKVRIESPDTLSIFRGKTSIFLFTEKPDISFTIKPIINTKINAPTEVRSFPSGKYTIRFYKEGDFYYAKEIELFPNGNIIYNIDKREEVTTF